MRTVLLGLSTLALALTGCGDDGGSTPIDASTGTPMISTVACAGATVAATVTAPGLMYLPNNVTLTTGQVVKFMMPASHNAKSRINGLFFADFNQETCVKFDSRGSFEFFCVPHLFTGTIVVN